MDGQVMHFELPAQDAARAREFWESLFGWKFRGWDGPVEYYMLGRQRAGGALYPDPDSAGSGPIVYFGTSDIDASRRQGARARRVGGRQAADPGHRVVRALRGHRGEPLLALPGGRLGAGARRGLAAEQSRGIEELELGCGLAEDRARRRARRTRGRARCRGPSSRPRPRRFVARERARRAAAGRASCRRSRPSGA